MVDSHWVCKLTEFGIKNINRESPDASQNNITHEHNKGAHPRGKHHNIFGKINNE